MRKNKIQLSDHFNVGRLLRFTVPSIVMMIFSSIYGVVDGFFVSNFVGKTSFAAVNFIMPFLMILGTFGFMFGTGGSALVAKTLGEGDNVRANRYFSLFVYLSAIIGVVIAVLGIIFIEPVAKVLGAEGQMLEDCIVYGRIILMALPFFMLQMEFQSFFVTAEKPKIGLFVTVAAGCTNIILDALLVGIFHFGLVGAALATAISQVVGGVIPLLYFFCKNSSILRLTKTKYDGKAVFRACTNGSSELMTNISMSLVSMLYNFQLLKYAGEDGIAAFGVIMYVNMIFLAAFIGYSIGIAPVVGFHYGAGNTDELKSLLRKSLWIIGTFSVSMLILSVVLVKPLSLIFVGYDQALYEMTCRGFYIYSISYLFSGFAIFGSGFFTALNDGLVSAIISFLRALVFQAVAILVLPVFWELDGVWFANIFAELLSVFVFVFFLFAKRKVYEY